MRTVVCLWLLWWGAILHAAERPNIILVMVDDMGFSDLGAWGGEIQTPNIDALAADGVRFSQFYNSGRCCPTRATLMTGLHPHQTGIGHMTSAPGRGPKPGPACYQGFLNDQCVTIAEVLRPAGYRTLMAGKWHLGMHDETLWPRQRGYDRFFGSLPGATRFFFPEHPRGMTLGNTPIDVPESTTEEAFYTTDAFTDYAMQFVDDHGREHSGDPFFLYLAFTAPHWPLQAFEDDIARYRGRYRAGWQALRKQRFERQKELGLIKAEWELSPPTPNIPKWNSLTRQQQDEMDLKMAIYAAMVDRVDQNMGRLVEFLKSRHLFDNTLIMFLSDNGACAEGGLLGRGEFQNVERRNLASANSYGEAWANASATPFRLYKHYAHEGGTATPFFMHWPAGISPQADWYREPAQLIDVMPTLIDVAGASYPERFRSHEIPPLDGISLRPAFTSKSLQRSGPLFIEHENNAFVREGDWKLVGRGVAAARGVVADKWELYDMRADRTETHDLSGQHPDVVQRLAAAWHAWSLRAGVYPKPAGKKKGAAKNAAPKNAAPKNAAPKNGGPQCKPAVRKQGSRPTGRQPQ
ncbi:MAG: arylsulfatase [Planctomycetaceae bacterium]|nr:arylsulfatase [Planctomycetaceae bacterium]